MRIQTCVDLKLQRAQAILIPISSSDLQSSGPDGNGEGEKGLGCIRLVAVDSSSNRKSIFRLARFESFVKRLEISVPGANFKIFLYFFPPVFNCARSFQEFLKREGYLTKLPSPGQSWRLKKFRPGLVGNSLATPVRPWPRNTFFSQKIQKIKC